MDVNVNILVMLWFLTHSWCHALLYDWTQEYLSSLIYIRLIKRDCRPPGPPIKTDELLNEYPWDVQTAFAALSWFSCEYVSLPLDQAENLFQDPNYDSSQDSIIITHPIYATADTFFTKTSVTALAMRNVHKSFNIFTVDMPYLNPYMMHTVARNVFGLQTQYPILAETTSSFIVKGINLGLLRPSQISIVGFSYSGVLVGYMARYIELLFGEKIGSILALDPYTNNFNEHLIQTSLEDAEVVHVFHTNSGFAGTRERIGTADFNFNDGNLQPECIGCRVLKNTIPEPHVCSHLKVVQRFWYVILYPSKFVARSCDTWNRLVSCYCDNNPTALMSYPFLRNQNATGTYYLRTLETKPYGVGVWGSECSSEARLELQNRRKMAQKKESVVME